MFLPNLVANHILIFFVNQSHCCANIWVSFRDNIPIYLQFKVFTIQLDGKFMGLINKHYDQRVTDQVRVVIDPMVPTPIDDTLDIKKVCISVN